MDAIRSLALLSVARGCGFATLAIAFTMLGLSFNIVLALKVGAFGFTLLAAVLWLRAERAERRDHRRTEIWTLLPKDQRPPAAVAQNLIARATRETCARVGGYAATFAVSLWVVEIAVAICLS